MIAARRPILLSVSDTCDATAVYVSGESIVCCTVWLCECPISGKKEFKEDCGYIFALKADLSKNTSPNQIRGELLFDGLGPKASLTLWLTGCQVQCPGLPSPSPGLWQEEQNWKCYSELLAWKHSTEFYRLLIVRARCTSRCKVPQKGSRQTCCSFIEF